GSLAGGRVSGRVSPPRPRGVGTTSPRRRPPPPSLSPCLSDVSGCSSRTGRRRRRSPPPLEVGGGHRKRVPADRAYFITKELLATERTYLRDLAALVTCLGGGGGGGGGGVMGSGASAALAAAQLLPAPPPLLLPAIASLQLLHTDFLRRVEQRMALWEGRSNAHLKGDFQKIGDILVHFIQTLKAQLPLLLSLEPPQAPPHASPPRPPLRISSAGGLLAKALQRPPHYALLLVRLCAHYPDAHPDRGDCAAALQEVSRITDATQEAAARMENAEKLAALDRDVVGIGKLSIPGKVFVREGRLLKLTRSGPQQRMFFLFLDALVYTRRDLTAHNQFPVAGRIPLHGMILIVLEPPEGEGHVAASNCFTIFSARKSMVLSASSPQEMEAWLSDLDQAICNAKRSGGGGGGGGGGGAEGIEMESELPAWTEPRPNSLSHVCWLRGHSLSLCDNLIMAKSQLSGYLLRKFKMSRGWQKLWVVFSNFCLHFYKNHQEDSPLAILPLLGYSVSAVDAADDAADAADAGEGAVAAQRDGEDGGRFDFVFRLRLRAHSHLFRAEGQFTFHRWLEVLSICRGPTRSSLWDSPQD
ncbi:unnamed protein product, partial [Lampetra planeri]